jgi:hypothetical protein
MDHVVFFEHARDDHSMVKVKLKNGKTIEGYPAFLDESDDNYLGFDFIKSDGVWDGCFLKDIDSVKRIEA